jgi:thiamine transport system permease protein
MAFSRTVAPTFIGVAIISGIVPLVWMATYSESGFRFDLYTWSIIRFTFMQAALSTALSVIPAIFIARALARRSFPGRNWLLAVLGVPLSMPAIVAVLGIAQIFGTAGWLGGWFNLYGLTGILIAHVFFNLPLATRFLLEAQQSIPAETHRLAAQLGLDEGSFFRTIEWPAIRPSLAAASALIFLLCASSFVIVLTLGGGPAATTLEVAIYQALRFDFDIARAVSLALIQLLFCAIMIALVSQSTVSQTIAPLRVTGTRFDGRTATSRTSDTIWIALAIAVVIPPLIAVILAGASNLNFSAALVRASATSVAIASCSAAFALILAWLLSSASSQHPSLRRFNDAISLSAWIVPPAVIATGWFIAFRGWDGGVFQAFATVCMLNALMALPFATSLLNPVIARHSKAHEKLCSQLGISGFAKLRLIDAPALKRPLMQALLMAFVLSLGDLTAVTLLGTQGLVTLPSLISQQMGSYRNASAAGTALFLAVLCYMLTWAAQKIGKA